MKIIKGVIGLVIFCLVFLIPTESDLQSDGYLKIGRPFVYYWETYAKTKNGISEGFMVKNLILDIVIYSFIMYFLIIIFNRKREQE